MSLETDRCPRCGESKAGWADGNCPGCLLRLGEGDLWDDPSTGSPSPRRLGDYELLDEIARGGMGVVYRARQVSLNRMVAVKVLLGGHFANESFIRRFRREAETAAGLSHPNIVAVHDVGEHEGQPYFSMELVEGRSLAELTREQPPPARQAAQWLKVIAEAVHYAHGRGVLHRDLKPSNILIDPQGVPRMTDFGLAKRFVANEVSGKVGEPVSGTPLPQAARSHSPAHPLTHPPVPESQSLLTSAATEELTLTGQVLGSPNYMPPEQADPQRGPTTVTSDVYSLGAILYHLLAGRPPFMAETVAQTLRLVTDGEPVSPRLLNPGVPLDLETICLKCLERSPARRYPSAQALADELGRFLADEPIHARPLGWAAKLARWRRRHAALAMSLGAVAGLMLLAIIGSQVALVHVARERRAAESARQQEATLRQRAESAERATEAQLYTALLEQARATVRSGELGQRVQALAAVRRAMTISNTAELRREVLAALALPDMQFEMERPRTPGMSPKALDSRLERIAWTRGRNAVEIRAFADDRLLASLPVSTNLPAHSLTWSPDDVWLVVERDHDGEGRVADVEVWNVAETQRKFLFPSVPWGATAFHRKQPWLMVGHKGGVARILDLREGREIAQLQLRGDARQLQFSPEGERLAASYHIGESWAVSVHRVANGTPITTTAIQSFVGQIDWHPGGRLLTACDNSGAIHLIDAATGASEVLGRHKSVAAKVTFSPDGGYLLTGGWENELICWDLRTKRRAFGVRPNGFEPQWSVDGRRCAVITDSGVKRYAFERPTSHREFLEELGTQWYAAFSPDGHWLAVSGDDRLGVWNLAGTSPGVVSESGRKSHLFFRPEGHEFFSSREGSFRRWRVTPGTNDTAPPQLESLPVHRLDGFYSAWLHSNQVALTDRRGTRVVALADIETAAGDPKPTAQGRNEISPDGRWLAVNPSFSPFVYVYRWPELERVAKLTNQANVSSFTFTPSGDEVVACSRHLLEVWSTKTWQPTREMPGFRSAFFAPDRETWWLQNDFSNAGLYHARTMEPLLLLPVGMVPMAVSPDGRHLAVSVDIRRLQVWDLAAVRAQLRALGMDWSP